MQKLFISSCILFSTICTATTQINENIQQFLYSQVTSNDDFEFNIRSFDNRVKIKSCNSEVKYNLSTNSIYKKRLLVNVSCDTPEWQLYIPVTVSLYKDVVITTRPISRKSIITASDVTIKNLDVISSHTRYFLDPNQVVGKQASQPIRAGKILAPNLLKTPNVIGKNEAIVISAISDGITVKMQGIALEGGKIGSIIRVKNISSQKIIEGTIINRGLVQVHM